MRNRKLLTLLPVLAAVLLLLGARTALAESPAQSQYATHSISVKWDDMTEEVSEFKNTPVTVLWYEVRWYDPSGTQLGKSSQLAASRRSCYISGLSSNTSYKVKLRIRYRINSSGEALTASKSRTLFTLPGTPKILSYSHRDDQKGLQLRLKTVPGNNPVRYEYQVASPAGKKLTSGSTGGSTLAISKFKYCNRAVKIRVRAYVTDSSYKKHYGSWSSYKPVVPQPVLYTDTSRYGVQRDGTMKLKWDRVIHATRYEVWISTTGPKSGYVKAGSVPANGSLTMTVSVPTWNGTDKFEINQPYYVMVLTCTKNIGKSAKNYYMSCELRTK